jgi:hypothetical protein
MDVSLAQGFGGTAVPWFGVILNAMGLACHPRHGSSARAALSDMRDHRTDAAWPPQPNA